MTPLDECKALVSQWCKNFCFLSQQDNLTHPPFMPGCSRFAPCEPPSVQEGDVSHGLTESWEKDLRGDRSQTFQKLEQRVDLESWRSYSVLQVICIRQCRKKHGRLSSAGSESSNLLRKIRTRKSWELFNTHEFKNVAFFSVSGGAHVRAAGQKGGADLELSCGLLATLLNENSVTLCDLSAPHALQQWCGWGGCQPEPSPCGSCDLSPFYHLHPVWWFLETADA